MLASEGMSYQKELSGAARSGGRKNKNKQSFQSGVSMAPTKKEKEEARLRRIAIREEYAKKTRFGKKSRSRSSSQSTEPSQQPSHASSPKRQARIQPVWEEDERPIQPMRGGAPKLDGDSQFQYGFDRKRNPLESLASGNTPPRATLEPSSYHIHREYDEYQSNQRGDQRGDALDQEVHNSGGKFVAKKYKPPTEHFSFSPER
jgi:hypothetical protein